ncbi:hypothetical protein COV49_01575 [Candidatus Falkowbacteria bacterium CG11_big_fil_rev_8_21_14_0_20_39_10]|uniref:Uncharacterized protein n=1 Tax=Candidatus Falkowbacteria bacterium CG11_big_fil_rev_8_21_14_0_20_39_10 TaxID=1974570 RepID=A0A2M6K9N6_9BACT|nr:MAG: hypothetical protein COV49_01575 [Candidatus Falkowbacteria bacterium CG11_big_fil_rev_8_21_14_0_20_39_10]
MNYKKFLKSSDLGITVMIVIGILVVINFLSYQIFIRTDLTENKDFSISKVSKRAVGELDDIVNIKVYFSKNLPSQYINLSQEVGDILGEYQAYSNGKIKVEFIDPETLENPEQELGQQGIPALQFNVLEKDKYQVVKGYLGMVIGYGDKKEPLPIVEDTRNLEYQVTLAIKKLTSQETVVVGFVSNNDSVPPEQIQAAKQKLDELYQTRSFELENEVPADIKTLVIAGPKEKFTEEQIKALDDFINRGGSILALVDGVKVGQNLSAEINDVGLDSFFEKYGIKLNHDLVLDVSSGMASFNSGFITFSTNYPFWPKILKDNFDQENAAVAKLETLILPWASSLDINEGKLGQEAEVSYLVKTTDKAWTQKDSFNLNPQQAFSPGADQGQKNLTVSVNLGASQGPSASSGRGRLIVVGDSDFIFDNFLGQSGDNLVFFQNLVDSLSLDEDLINIRSKAVSSRPLKELTEANKNLVKYLNIFGITVLVVAFGLGRYYMRRRSRFVDEL